MSEPHTDRLRTALADRLPLVVTGKDVLFVHWRVDRTALRDVVPEPLTPHTIDGTGRVSVLAQDVVTAAPRSGSAVSPPAFPQLNVGTCVEYEGDVGVYFIDLLTGNRLGPSLGLESQDEPLVRYSPGYESTIESLDRIHNL